LKRVLKWLEATSELVRDDFDRLVPVVGDEGMGKSTLIMQLGWFWREHVGRPQTVDGVVDMIAWDLEGFQDMLAESPQYQCIMVHDAARVMSRKKAMHGEQVEVEEDLLDARFGNYLMLLGYQEFDVIPTMLATRRAKNLLYVPERGVVHGYNEEGIRERYDEGSWPEPTMRDTFPDISGTDLWEAFEEEDQRRKRERMKSESKQQQDSVQSLARDVVAGGVKNVVSIHGGHNKPYIDADLIEVEHMTSGNKSKKAAKLLKKWKMDGHITLDMGPREPDEVLPVEAAEA
jgi:hypothetical protein